MSKFAYETKEETIAAVINGNKGRQLRKDLGLTEKLSFRQIELTPENLLEHSLAGYTFCGLFSNFPLNTKDHTYVKRDGYFTLSGKSSEYFQGSYFIGIDVDETNYTEVENLVGCLSLKPTFWYTSLSNKQIELKTGKNKGLRLRLIYVFDEMIEDPYYFRYCSYNLHRKIEDDLNEIVKDKCGLSCTQYFNGTSSKSDKVFTQYGITNRIYSLFDIDVSDSGYYNFLLNGCHYSVLDSKKEEEIKDRLCKLSCQSDIFKKQHTQVMSVCPSSLRAQRLDGMDVMFDDQLLDDASLLRWSDFYEKYKHIYPYVYRVEKVDWLQIGEVKYQLCDESYLELRWISQRITDGQHRRNILFHRGCLRRIILPEITPSVLLFNFMVDRERFFDNRDGVLNLICLIEKVKECFKLSSEEYINIYPHIYSAARTSCRNKKFIIKHGLNKKVCVSEIAKEIRWRLLEEIYDVNMTLEDNQKTLSDNDIIVSNRTLRRFLIDRGIPVLKESDLKYNAFKEYHHERMSAREEAVYLGEKGIKISHSTVLKFRKRLQVESESCK